MKNNKRMLPKLLARIQANDNSVSERKIAKTLRQVWFLLIEPVERDKTNEKALVAACLRHANIHFDDWVRYSSLGFEGAVQNPALPLWILWGQHFPYCLNFSHLANAARLTGDNVLAASFYQRYIQDIWKEKQRMHRHRIDMQARRNKASRVSYEKYPYFTA